MFLNYKPPKKLRALFIAHYAPLLLIILIGPVTPLFRVWQIPLPEIPTILLGIAIFTGGAIFFLKWEFFWEKTYKGQLVTTGFFRYMRHPHYTSLLVINFGLALFFYSILALFIATISFPILVWSMIDEEKLLLKQFGEEYKKYMEEVPWRMIPGVF